MSDEHDARTIRDLRAQCLSLQEELGKVKREQVTYLQNISHQLVAPLNAIKWHIENITSSRLSVERAQKVLRSIYSQSTIAVHLAKNFALMSNLEEDHALSALKEPLQPVSLCRLAINLADDFQPLGWEKDVHVQVEKGGFEDALEVLVMRPLISQVFSNVIENGIKYSRSGSVVRIRGSHSRAADCVIVVITSTGIPLPDPPDQVFKRGYRSEAAKNQYPAGTGFGLYIARRIVDIHGGRIRAQMEDEKASFAVTLSVRGLEGKARTRDAKDRAANR